MLKGEHKSDGKGKEGELTRQDNKISDLGARGSLLSLVARPTGSTALPGRCRPNPLARAGRCRPSGPRKSPQGRPLRCERPGETGSPSLRALALLVG